jgi:hypothetical protein
MDEFTIEFIVQLPQVRLLTATVFRKERRLLVLHHFDNADALRFSIQLTNWVETWLDRRRHLAQWSAKCDGMNAVIIIESLRKHAGAEIGEVASPNFRKLYADSPRRLTRDLRGAIKALVEV